MLHAQGSITVRRRPKDGNPGADAVRYWLVPSVSQIKKTDDGKFHPTSITCEKRKQTGNSSPIATSEGTLKYQIGYTDNSVSALTNYSSAITIPAKCQWIKFVLYVNSIDVATETVPVVADGESVFLLDLDNEMQGIPCNSSGTPTISGTLASTNSTVYKGASIDSGWTFSKTDSGCTSSINASTGVVTVTAISADKASVTVNATKGSQTLSAVMSLYKVKAGADGKQGIQGCVYRRSKFDTGFEYHNDSALTNDGIRYIDLVYIMKDNTMYASHALWFRCKKTHTSSDENAPRVGDKDRQKWDAYWEPMNTLEPLYTPLLLADDAVITLMQSNQILIANDDGVITAGMSGSLSGSKIRIWAGAETPDNAPFRVDVNGSLVATKANITGTIKATDGKIAGFNISGNSLTNGPDFNNDACIIFRNDTHHTFAGIGGNVLASTSGLKAVARFENEDYNNFWGLGRNIAMLLSAKHGDINHAFIGSGNGNLDGWISGYKYSKFNLSSSDTIYNGYLKISENNVWVVYAYSSVSGSGVVLPKLSEVRTALGISDSQQFCIPFTIVADLFSSNFYVYGRNSIEDSNKNKPWNVDDIPVFTHWDGDRWDRLEMGKGDALTVLLIYEPSRTGSLNKFSIKYTARVLSLQNK